MSWTQSRQWKEHLRKQTNVHIRVSPFHIYVRGKFALKPAMKFTCSVRINWPAGFIQMLIEAFRQIQLRVPLLRKLKIYKLTFNNIVVQFKFLLKLKYTFQ